MAVATIAITETHNYSAHSRGYTMFGFASIGASPLTYTTGGISISLASSKTRASKVPLYVRLFGQSITAGQGCFDYVYIPGSTRDNGLVKIFSSGAELVGGSAIPVGVSSDIVNFEAFFKGTV